MTPSQGALLRELIRSADFEAIVDEIVATDTAVLVRDMRTAVNNGDQCQAAQAEGRIQVTEKMFLSFKRLADRYRLTAPETE